MQLFLCTSMYALKPRSDYNYSAPTANSPNSNRVRFQYS